MIKPLTSPLLGPQAASTVLRSVSPAEVSDKGCCAHTHGKTEMNRASPTMLSMTTEDGGPLLSVSGRIAVGPATVRQVDGGGLSPVDDRPFLLRFLEPIKVGKHEKTGATLPETTNPDGDDEGKEDFGLPDYEP